jgi:hypothetical protein
VKPNHLYHRDIFFPEDLLQLSKQKHIQLTYAPTAREHAKHDALPIRGGIDVTWTNIVEVGSAQYLKPSDSIERVVVREPLDADTDLVFDIKTDLRSGHGTVVRTTRANARKPHYSARLSEYISC